MPVWAKRFVALPGLLALLFVVWAEPGKAQTSDLVSNTALRVCADPANTPASSEDLSGYENKLADLIASKLDLPVQYTWFPMATGFIRQTLMAKRCDVVMGYAQGHELVLNTNHYMTSVYTLVTPKDSPLADVARLNDPRLKDQAIGVVAGTPPSAHMARHGLMAKARPYNLFVDRRVDSPAENMLRDLKAGELDAAVLWGPIGGPLVKQGYPEFQVTPLINEDMPPRLFFRITMGVRQGEKVWQRELNSLIRRHQDEINQVMLEAGVPLIQDMGDALMEIEN
jgi:quinoprotein dehydrogenase-associated probable ABC transporter substrate-binding protein